ALRADDLQRSTWFAGRAVFVANGAEEKLSTPDGRTLSKFHSLAIALNSLLGGTPIRRPRPIRLSSGLYIHGRYVFETFSVVVGAAVVLLLHRRLWRYLAIAVTVGLVFVFSIMFYRFSHAVYYPFAAAGGVLIVAILIALAKALSQRDQLAR